MPDEESDYICPSCLTTYLEGQCFQCQGCNMLICRKCGTEVRATEGYFESMMANDED